MGGAEQQVAHLARAMAGRGWEVGVVSMLPLESPIADLAGDWHPARVRWGCPRACPTPVPCCACVPS